ncbi:hypothetical protein H5410_002845 [Solanum commersonii]|uniref:DUF1985 domain-containing protein n=1 Tax=Solanum commersonii TaxID=4109 RepID=A0A9J6B3B7_SOLCO|nr:hypothetical protein H5410_002845 [Solanum commersonii]
MPLFFGKKKFAIVTGLKCHSPSEPIHKREAQTSKEQSTEEQDLVSLIGPSFKNSKLIALLNDKDTSKKHKELLYLLWFVHNVLMSKDVNNNIPLNYGHDNYELTIKYLFAPLSPKTNNLFVFLWAFMISSPRILRWLTTKNVKNPLDLFNPPHDAVSC